MFAYVRKNLMKWDYSSNPDKNTSVKITVARFIKILQLITYNFLLWFELINTNTCVDSLQRTQNKIFRQNSHYFNHEIVDFVLLFFYKIKKQIFVFH